MQNRYIPFIIGIIAIILIGISGIFIIKAQRKAAREAAMQNQQTLNQDTSQNIIQPSPSNASPSAMINKNTVTVNSDGFSPKQITVKAGDSITFINQDSVKHTVNSNPHPTHTDYPPLNTIGLLNPGDQKTLMFPDIGTYKYHDHLNPSLMGIIIVQ